MQSNKFMQLAVDQAKEALTKKEFPIGCIITQNDKIIASAHNLTNTLSNPLAHAELNCLKLISNYENLTVYVNVEPCVMCMDIIQKLNCKLYFGVYNQIFGAKSILGIVYGEYMECQESVLLMKNFYEMENELAPENLRISKVKRI
ncbi:tRNA(adenine34) deaminase [Conglomerata obtusa]